MWYPPFNICGHPYVGIIQIRLWVKAYASSQPTSVSSPSPYVIVKASLYKPGLL